MNKTEKIIKGGKVQKNPPLIVCLYLFILIFGMTTILFPVLFRNTLMMRKLMEIDGFNYVIVFIFPLLGLYLVYKFRFEIRHSLDALFLSDPVVEISAKGITILRNKKSVLYSKDFIDSIEKYYDTDSGLWEIIIDLKDTRAILLKDEAQWPAFNTLKKWFPDKIIE